MLLEEQLDLVLLDLGLDRKGIELLDRAERLPPVILMSESGEHSISDARISLLPPMRCQAVADQVAAVILGGAQ